MTMILDGTLGITATGSLTGLTTAITAAQGGTGAATLTANNVLLGNGTSAVTFVAPSTSGNLLTSNGTTWTSTAPAASGGMTLLGTLTMTSGTSQTLSGLTLTNYKQVQIVGSGVSTTYVANQAGGVLLSPNTVRLTPDSSQGADTQDFFAFVDLATGICTSSYVINAGSPVAPYVRNSGLSTSATSITLTAGNSTSYDAGTVKIYGVA